MLVAEVAEKVAVMSEAIRMITPVFRGSFVHVAKAKAYTDPKTKVPGTPLFSLNAILKAEELKQFKAFDETAMKFVDVSVSDIAIAEVKKQWPTDTDTPEKLQGFINALKFTKKWPFLDGSEVADKAKAAGKDSEFTRGFKLLKASSVEKVAPNMFQLVGREKKQLHRESPTDMKTAESLFYSGGYFYAEITPSSGNAGGQPYVKFYLNAVVFVKHGERIGGGNSLIGRFDGVIGGEDATTDVTQGLSEEIAF